MVNRRSQSPPPAQGLPVPLPPQQGRTTSGSHCPTRGHRGCICPPRPCKTMTPQAGREHDGMHLKGRAKSSPVLRSLSWRPRKGSTWQDKPRCPLGQCPAHYTSRAHRAGDASGSTAPWSSTKRHPGTPPLQLLRQPAKYKMNATHSQGLVCLG